MLVFICSVSSDLLNLTMPTPSPPITTCRAKNFGEARNVEMDGVVAAVSGQSSMHDAFSGRGEELGMFSLWPLLSHSKIFNWRFGVIHTKRYSTYPRDFEGQASQAN